MNKKLLILETAQRQILSNGPRGVNARTIAEMLDMRPSHVFYYFRTQQDLMSSLVTYIVTTNARFVEEAIRLANPQGSIEKVMAYVRGNLTWGKRHPESISVLLYGFTELVNDKALGLFVRQALAAGEKKVCDMVAIGLGQGEYRSSISAVELGKTVHQLLIGCMINQFYSDNPEEMDCFRERIERVFMSFIDVSQVI